MQTPIISDAEFAEYAQLDEILYPVITFLKKDPYFKSSNVQPVELTMELIRYLNKPDIRDCISLIVRELNYSKIPDSVYNIFTNILNALALTATFIMMEKFKLKNTTLEDKECLKELKEKVIDSWKLVE